jgi:hypothetical protein
VLFVIKCLCLNIFRRILASNKCGLSILIPVALVCCLRSGPDQFFEARMLFASKQSYRINYDPGFVANIHVGIVK